jgi:hypothetical protein
MVGGKADVAVLFTEVDLLGGQTHEVSEGLQHFQVGEACISKQQHSQMGT